MGAIASELPALLSGIYASGIGERSWLDTLGSIGSAFGAVGANAFDISHRTRSPLTCYIGDGNVAGHSDYIEYIHTIDPRLKHAMSRRGAFISCDYDVLPEAAMRRHEYYDWLNRVCDMKYHLGSKFFDSEEMFSCISIELGVRHGPPDREDFELLQALTPHIANSWKISQRLVQAGRIDDFNLALLETVPWGVVTLDHRGEVLSVNRAARKIIARDDGLRIVGRELHANRAADDRKLQHNIGLSLRLARGEGLQVGGAMAVGRANETVPYAVRVLPLRHVTGTLPEGLPFVSVVVSDPATPRLPDETDLRSVFGFSAREAQIALSLASGVPIADAAPRLGIAKGTARTHLANAMAKVGVKSQAALVGLVRGLPGEDEPL